jgi:putative phosphonate metabolism protein
MIAEPGTDGDHGLAGSRYAIYFVPPPESGLKRFADAWLGRDPDRDEPVAQPTVEGLAPERLGEITAPPRHYGFHATLKAPFCPRPEVQAADLQGELAAFAAARRPIGVRLKVAELDRFVALVPAEASAAVDRLAADCVRAFDRHRAPLHPADRERRAVERLSAAQRDHLERWGYPYVFDQFRFHMTLTGPLAEPERRQTAAVLEAALASHLAEPVVIDQLALLAQTGRAAPFRVVARFPFGA